MAISAADQNFIVSLYVGYFNRAPDPVGLQFWISEVEGGRALDTIAADFAASTEATALYPFLTTPDVSSSASFITAIYQNLFNRPPLDAGLEFWTGVLEAGSVTPGDMIDAIIKGATTAPDSVIITNKTAVGLDFAVDAANTAGFTFDAAAKAAAISATSGVDETDASVVAAKAATDAFTTGANTAGQTFTLTTALDNLTGTSGNDTFLGDASTTSLGDQLDGGEGTDTVKFFGNASNVSISNVEVVELTGNTAGFDVSGNADVTTLNLIDASTAQTYTVSNGTNVSVATMVDAEVIDFAGNSVTALNLTVNGLGSASGAGVDVDLNSTTQTTLNLATVSNASHIELVNTGAKLTTVSVEGDQSLTLDADSNAVALTSVNGSTSTGALNLVLDDAAATAVTVTGGTGNDTANFGDELTQTDKFDGGDGTDTLEVTQASVTAVQGLNAIDKATLNTNLANVEVVEVTDALTSNIDASRFDGVNNFVLSGGLNNGATSTLSKVTSGVSVSIGDAATTATDILAVAITDASLAGNNSDEVTLNLTDAAAAGSSNAGVVNLAGVDSLTINTTQASGGTTTAHVIDIANTATALDKITVLGNTALDISTVPLVNSIGEIDASGMTLASSTAVGLSVAVAAGGTNGVLITGSGGIDSLKGGGGADIIVGGAGADVLEGQGGADKFVFASADSGVTTATADIIADFVTTADSLSLGTAGTVANFFALDTDTGGTDQISTVEAAVLLADAATGSGTSFDGTVQYMLLVDTTSGADGYLIADNDLDGDADFVVELTGLTATANVAFGDIVA